MTETAPVVKIPKLDAVESSNVQAMGYDPESKILATRFHTSRVVYVYRDVPAEVVAFFKQPGASIGALMNSLIRGKYEFTTEAHVSDADDFDATPVEPEQLPLALIEDETNEA